MTKIKLISPRLSFQKGDFLGSGVPYWPIELATFASFLKQKDFQVEAFDLFGSNPKKISDCGAYYLQGEPVESFKEKFQQGTDEIVFIYAISSMSHDEIISIVQFIKKNQTQAKIVILENSQAVTSYSLTEKRHLFFAAGADFLCAGEIYWNFDEVLTGIQSGDCPTNLLKSSAPDVLVQRIFNQKPVFPIPDWQIFPFKNYWSLPYSHGPKTSRYFPIMTSRGCPYPCDFCVVPSTNSRKWRGRAAEDVVNEILTLRDNFGVYDFQIEDLNPTVNEARFIKICELLIEKNAGIRFYIVSGTKAETISLTTVPLLAKAGCRFISISPESGSQNVMKSIGKPFDYVHGLNLVKACHSNNIKTQACFVVGHPKEAEQDHKLSAAYLKTLVQGGLSEVAIFIINPLSGSQLFKNNAVEFNSDKVYSSFSPVQRSDYAILQKRRSELIQLFFVEKLKMGIDLFIQGVRAMTFNPKTKMENLPIRIIFIWGLVASYKIKHFFGLTHEQ